MGVGVVVGDGVVVGVAVAMGSRGVGVAVGWGVGARIPQAAIRMAIPVRAATGIQGGAFPFIFTIIAAMGKIVN